MPFEESKTGKICKLTGTEVIYTYFSLGILHCAYLIFRCLCHIIIKHYYACYRYLQTNLRFRGKNAEGCGNPPV